MLLVGAPGCTPATYGLGDGDLAASEGSETSGGDGDDAGDGDAEDGETGDSDDDGGAVGLCADLEEEVFIQLIGPDYAPGSCDEPTVTGWVESAEDGVYVLSECPCDELGCGGEKLTLTIIEPDPSWLPPLQIGHCYVFDFSSDLSMANACRKSRVDIFDTKEPPPWYSTGSTADPGDLSVNGFSVAAVGGRECGDECGEWMLHDISFEVAGTTEIVPRGTLGTLESDIEVYALAAWNSYSVTPAECGEILTETGKTVWAAQRTSP